MSVEPLQEFITSLVHHDREILLGILEVADKAMILDCHEKEIFMGLKLALWKSVKIEEMK